MTMLMHDAVGMLSPEATDAYRNGLLFDTLYADDTILLGSIACHVQEYALAIQRAGARYGLSLHWLKTQALTIGSDRRLQRPDGSTFASSEFLEYLGGQISKDGRADSEISRKIGRAYADLKLLSSLWSHAGVSRKDKVYFFNALVLSRLAYGLSTQWLVTVQRRRLDGFVARCLRRMLGIPSAYISRVSNASVYAQAGIQRFSDQLLKQQLVLLGKVALAPDGSPLRNNTFAHGTLIPQIGRFIRKVGRPRQNWTSQLVQEGISRLGYTRFFTPLQDRSQGAYTYWKNEMSKSFAAGK